MDLDPLMERNSRVILELEKFMTISCLLKRCASPNSVIQKYSFDLPVWQNKDTSTYGPSLKPMKNKDNKKEKLSFKWNKQWPEL